MNLFVKKPNIIYVAGFPRSGTTWFANLINSSESVVYRHEILGRKGDAFGEELFKAIKFANGLTESQYIKAIDTIAQADIETDKPPFFKKKEGLLKYPKLHHYLWLAAKVFSPIRPVYNRLFKVNPTNSELSLLIKETGVAKDISSITTGLKVANILVLIRSPHGAIASRVRGVKSGKMPPATALSRKSLFENNKHSPYIQSLNYDSEAILSLSDVELTAIGWRVYYENLFRQLEYSDGVYSYLYEKLVDDTESEVKKLFEDLNLEFDKGVANFIRQSSNPTERTALPKDSPNEFYSVYKSSTFDKDSWKKSLSKQEIDLINKHTLNYYEALKKGNYTQ